MRVLVLVLGLVACSDQQPELPPPPPVVGLAPVAVPANKHAKRRPASTGTPAQNRAFYATKFSRQPTVPELMAIGEIAFRDRSLSHTGTLACESCHDPAHVYAPTADRPGLRVAPSLRYVHVIPVFTEHFVDPELDTGEDQGPAGGLTWDGRAQSLHDQARAPLFSRDEMGLTGDHELATKLARTRYAPQLRATFGADIFASDGQAVKALLLALETFQEDPPRFYPYTSKYDDVARGTATFSPTEARGKALFDDPAKGNCARCHPDIGPFPAFSDYGYVALGVPAAPGGKLDLGLCGPLRTDLASHREYCGKFRTPSLRNVATRKRFFHNGALRSLVEVVRFYATRDATPAKWKSDLPAPYRINLDVEPPFGGKTPALTEPEIQDLVAFLRTLSDR
ncbi:MAG: cytochrome c peroxidase [Kofleriaceae bacterium]